MHPYQVVILGVMALLGLSLTSLYSYLLFHSLVEISTVIISFGIFIVAWNCRRYLDNKYLLFLGIAYLFVALIDLLHALAYKGMGVFPGFDANLSTQLWIAARYLQSISLFIATWFINRKFKSFVVFSSYSIVSLFLLLSIFYWHIFPDCFLDVGGLTAFKKISEYVISFILVGAMAVLWEKRQEFDRAVLWLISCSLLLTILSELSFTFYVSVYGLSNLIGHLFKITAFYFIYKAIIKTGLVKPYNLLFRDLKQSEERYRLLVDQIPAVVFKGQADWSSDFFDRKIEALTGYSKEDFDSHRLKWSDLILTEDLEPAKQQIIKALKTDYACTREYRIRKKSGEIAWIQSREQLFCDAAGKIDYISGVLYDITVRKRAEMEREKLIRELQDALGQVRNLHGQINDILSSIGDGFFSLNNDMIVTFFNKTAEKLLGRKNEEVVGRRLFEAFPEAKGSVFEEKYALALDKKITLAFDAYFDVEPYVNWYEVRVSPYKDGISVYFQVITARKIAEAERERLIKELQDALAQVKILRGFLPICAHCKKIRDDAGYWQQIEQYIHEHSEAEFSHGICPDCLKEHYPDFSEAE